MKNEQFTHDDERFEPVPRYVHQHVVARDERTIKRLWIALLVSVALGFAATFGSNIAWLVYESQFDTTLYSQDGDGLNNVNTGMQGAVSYGTESESQG